MRRNRGWIWFFVTVFTLAIGAGVTLIVYNIKQQLKPEDLQAAWELWKKKGPADYDVVYEVLRPEQPPEIFVVRVRNKTTTFASRNDKEEEARLRPYRGMDALFEQVTEFMLIDSQPGKPRTYVRGVFDPADGHLWWYVRRVMGTTQRVEIRVLELRAVRATSTRRASRLAACVLLGRSAERPLSRPVQLKKS